ncbi:MAG: hypothetical protein AB7G88_07215 [Thermomicrobiales bacterium]
MGQQLDHSAEPFGPPMLAAVGVGFKGHRRTSEIELPPPVQKRLGLPHHLTRPLDAIDFAHPTEQDLARVFSYFRVNWVYEPTTFHLEVDDAGRPTEQVCPDFYLPDHDMYVELTTMRQKLVTRKNRKIRRLKEAFPSLRIKLLYRKDYDLLMGSLFGSDGEGQALPGKPVVSERQLEQRIRALAGEIASSGVARRRYPQWGRPGASPPESADQLQRADESASDLWGDVERPFDDLCLVGLGNDSIPFLTALEFELKLVGLMPVVDVMTLSQPESAKATERVGIERKPSLDTAGRDIVLVTGIVSTGLSAAFAADWLCRQGARSVRICTLFDRSEARILDVPISWAGFAAPHEVLVGYGIAYQHLYHDLPSVAALKSSSRARSRIATSGIALESP